MESIAYIYIQLHIDLSYNENIFSCNDAVYFFLMNKILLKISMMALPVNCFDMCPIYASTLKVMKNRFLSVTSCFNCVDQQI